VHMHLSGEAGAVSYASSCEFRGHVVPHLVVQTAQGPVTVMVLVHEAAAKEVQFDERGYRGVIVPLAGHGSIALLMRSSDARMNVEEVAARVREAIVWSP
jgi:succinyl-CoA synthetase beta subunit